MDYFRLEDIGFKTSISNRIFTRSDLILENLLAIVAYGKGVMKAAMIGNPDFNKLQDLYANQDRDSKGIANVVTIKSYKFSQPYCYAALSLVDYHYHLPLNNKDINTEKIAHIKYLRGLFDPDIASKGSSVLNLFDAKMIIENWTHIKAIFGHTGGIPYLSDNGITWDSINIFLRNKKTPLANNSNLWLAHKNIAQETGYDLFWDTKSAVDLTF